MVSNTYSAASLYPSRRGTGISLLTGYLALYAVTLYAMAAWGHFAADVALGVAAVLGAGFSIGAWLLTIGVRPLTHQVWQPGTELLVLGVYIIPLVGVVTWGFDALRRAIPNDPAQAVALLVLKLVVFVAIPAWIMSWRFGYSWKELAPSASGTSHMLAVVGMAFLLLLFQSTAGRGLRDISAAHVSGETMLWGVPLAFAWLALEAGVVEEFFFRCLLQSRLSAALRSELGGIVLMALLFGLIHAPGLYLRTSVTQEGLPAHPALWMAIGYSIVITSVAGFFLGVLWARTRNLAVVVLVHAAADLLPDFLPTLRSLHLLP